MSVELKWKFSVWFPLCPKMWDRWWWWRRASSSVWNISDRYPLEIISILIVLECSFCSSVQVHSSHSVKKAYHTPTTLCMTRQVESLMMIWWSDTWIIWHTPGRLSFNPLEKKSRNSLKLYHQPCSAVQQYIWTFVQAAQTHHWRCLMIFSSSFECQLRYNNSSHAPAACCCCRRVASSFFKLTRGNYSAKWSRSLQAAERVRCDEKMLSENRSQEKCALLDAQIDSLLCFMLSCLTLHIRMSFSAMHDAINKSRRMGMEKNGEKNKLFSFPPALPGRALKSFGLKNATG